MKGFLEFILAFLLMGAVMALGAFPIMALYWIWPNRFVVSILTLLLEVWGFCWVGGWWIFGIMLGAGIFSAISAIQWAINGGFQRAFMALLFMGGTFAAWAGVVNLPPEDAYMLEELIIKSGGYILIVAGLFWIYDRIYN